jgi:hypothetical protein
MKTIAPVVALVVAGLVTLSSAPADVLIADFVITDGSASGGQVTFTLSGNETIAGGLTSTAGNILGLAFDCADHFVPSGFFAGDYYDTAWFDMYGVQASGIATSGNPATSLTWTIGSPGDFT